MFYKYGRDGNIMQIYSYQNILKITKDGSNVQICAG